MTSVLGSVTRTTQGRENWVGDGYIGFLKAGSKLISGRWYRREDLWEYSPDNSNDVQTISARSEWEVLDGYWGQRAELVLDETRQWQEAVFQPVDAIKVKGPRGLWLRPATECDADGEKLESGWDHEHCAICWAKLGRAGQSNGYLCIQGVWVCERCYLEFVQQRSLAFIPSG